MNLFLDTWVTIGTLGFLDIIDDYQLFIVL